MDANAPDGGVSLPYLLFPQHTAAPSARMPQVLPPPALMARKVIARGTLVDVGVLSTVCCARALSEFASRVNSNNAAVVKAVRK